MSKSLHFNICNLKSSFLLDEDDNNLPDQVATNIGSELHYACQYWAAHLTSVHDPQDVEQLSAVLLEFCSLKVLFWMEAMNLLKLNCRLPLHLARIWALQVNRDCDVISICLHNRLGSKCRVKPIHGC
jgi:hypothetical protein